MAENEKKETKAHEKKEAKKGKQRIHKDTNTAIKKGMQRVASHDSANCDSDYCDSDYCDL